MAKKLFSIITLLLLASSSLFAESIGFASVHSGFWWWAGAVGICAVSIAVISYGLGMLFLQTIFERCFDELVIFGFWIFITSVFSILGFWIIPSILCGLVFGIVGAILYTSLFYCICEDVELFPWVLSLLICALTIAAGVFVMIYLPNKWWLWKYVSVAVLGSGIANILAFDSRYLKKVTSIDTILLIVDFITFWIVFGICKWNVVSIILGITFCSLVLITMISPFICMIIRKDQNERKETEEKCAIVEQMNSLAVEISNNPNYIKSHPEYKEFYKDNKTDIDNRVKKILNDIKQQEAKRIQEELDQKKQVREEEARETAFQRNLKSISEDVDVLELAVGKGTFDIRHFTILENHISVLCENKSILNENNREILQKKKKYLEAIFQDCEKLPDCKGSAKIRMQEILKMLDDLNKSGN